MSPEAGTHGRCPGATSDAHAPAPGPTPAYADDVSLHAVALVEGVDERLLSRDTAVTGSPRRSIWRMRSCRSHFERFLGSVETMISSKSPSWIRRLALPAAAVQAIWTADHLDAAARRPEGTLVAPARTAVAERALIGAIAGS